MKILLEFNSMLEMTQWADNLVNGPTMADAATESKVTKPKKTDPEPEEKKTKAKEAASTSAISEDEFTELKELGIKLADSEKYEGVSVVLAKYGIKKIKELKAEDYAQVKDYFDKMLAADSTKFAKMVAHLSK